MPSYRPLMIDAIKQKLFDPEWYKFQYSLNFNTDIETFNDYIRKSTFADVSPSPIFNNSQYLLDNPDVYVDGISPLTHYLTKGKKEGRAVYPYVSKWTPISTISAASNPHKRIGRYAIVLHIFYLEFVEKFYDATFGVDFEFDLFVTSTEQNVIDACKEKFSTHPQMQNLKAVLVPNRGRNFGPFLVEFGQDLREYDYFLHLHSKKSLYSGREQVQWSNFLNEYLVRDKHILSQGLNILENNPDYGLYYPTSFWNLPPWVNHWLKNRGLGRHVLRTMFGIDHEEEFFAYPVGGMFWARTAALEDLLQRRWSYEDFPAEPLPADGSFLHVLERILPILSRKQGYEQFFYDPSSGTFTTDTSFIYKEYISGNKEKMYSAVKTKKIVSFDIFDTIVKRDYYEPDLAKFLLPERAQLDISPTVFVDLRNEAERLIRQERNYQGDVDILEIYEKLKPQLSTRLTAPELSEMEFTLDLEMLKGKRVMVDLVNQLAKEGKVIYFISDTYYTDDQIRRLIEQSGIECQYQLFVSSKLGLRKDNASMWAMLNDKLISDNSKQDFIHIGDNVCSDAQNPGDLGLATYHILHPLDKWSAVGAPDIRSGLTMRNPNMVAKWGPLVAEIGSNPFI